MVLGVTMIIIIEKVVVVEVVGLLIEGIHISLVIRIAVVAAPRIPSITTRTKYRHHLLLAIINRHVVAGVEVVHVVDQAGVGVEVVVAIVIPVPCLFPLVPLTRRSIMTVVVVEVAVDEIVALLGAKGTRVGVVMIAIPNIAAVAANIIIVLDRGHLYLYHHLLQTVILVSITLINDNRMLIIVLRSPKFGVVGKVGREVAAVAATRI